MFSTEFCSKSHSAEIMKFGLGECKCPCCEYPELARTILARYAVGAVELVPV